MSICFILTIQDLSGGVIVYTTRVLYFSQVKGYNWVSLEGIRTFNARGDRPRPSASQVADRERPSDMEVSCE